MNDDLMETITNWLSYYDNHNHDEAPANYLKDKAREIFDEIVRLNNQE